MRPGHAARIPGHAFRLTAHAPGLRSVIAADSGPAKVTVSDDVSVIEDSDIATVNENSVAFAQPVSYSAGDVIVAGVTEHTPAGMLRKVTAVSADGRTISTEPATLEDVVQDGTLVVSGELRESDLTEASRKAVADAGIILNSGRGLQPAASGGFAFGYDIPNVEFSQGSHSLQIDGSIRFSLDYDLQVDYRAVSYTPRALPSSRARW